MATVAQNKSVTHTLVIFLTLVFHASVDLFQDAVVVRDPFRTE